MQIATTIISGLALLANIGLLVILIKMNNE
mgnify:CR=1 FL=1